MDITEALRHAGNVMTAEAEERARLALPSYMFTDGDPRHREGYCTCCESARIPIRQDAYFPDWVVDDPYLEIDDDGGSVHHVKKHFGFDSPWMDFKNPRTGKESLNNSGRHGDYGRCPICGTIVQYRSFNMGRKTLRDRIFLIRYQRSRIEENTLVMLGYLVICDWKDWDDYNEAFPSFYMDLREICVFRPGEKGELFTTKVTRIGEQDNEGRWVSDVIKDWVHPKQCIGGYDPWQGSFQFGYALTDFYLDEESVENAIGGTPWEDLYRKVKSNFILDRIDFFAQALRYPCVEYLMKLGYKQIAVKVLAKETDRVLNLKGTTAQKVLRVDPNFYGWMKGNAEDPPLTLLRNYQAAKKRKLRIGNDALLWISQHNDGYTDAQELMDHLKEKTNKAIRYLMKSRVKAWEYLDHVKMMEELGISLNDSAVLFPRDFGAMHTELAGRRKVKRNKDAEKKLAKRTDSLGAWWYSALGLTIRPMLTADEIIREGNELRHCVGGYVDKYAEGGTILLALRQEEAPGTPWRTVEYATNGKLVQCRGYRNRSPEDEQDRIDRFLGMFDAYRAEYEKLHKKQTKRKEGRAAA